MKKSFLNLLTLSCTLLFASCDKTDDVAKSSYTLNEENAVVEWKGYSPSLYHDGSFAVTSEGIDVVGGKVKGGTFIIPIASIQNFDLPVEVKPVLLEHLKSPDFFNIALHPEAKFKITHVRPSTAPAEGAVAGANAMVTGDFTMIGNTHSISFPAKIVFAGSALEIEARFPLDRTKWGMTYAADPALGEHHILPNVDIHLQLTAHKL